MRPDDHVCYCFHVSLRKIENFCRNTKPQHASQMSECLSAGTGCGWCVPLLRKIHKRTCAPTQPWWRANGDPEPETASAEDYASAQDYAAARDVYIRRKNASPQNAPPANESKKEGSPPAASPASRSDEDSGRPIS